MSGWTAVNYTEAGSFSGSVLTDGHLCVISVGEGEAMGNDNGEIIYDLPLPEVPVCFMAFQDYSNIMPLGVDVYGMLMVLSTDYYNPEMSFNGFTIVYPVAS